ncbi:hypothetical protein HGM15179_017280 [Zosterops borbonicus]|uniref:Reverse transcriptase domain-containing protein n=1 Tax=Zosterops borbonicus TaxID=364589 RepID=A0A8K1LDH8_9PASS|nr:hypothetical protein HGM15179_017280 [Zosterops borbonicus]
MWLIQESQEMEFFLDFSKDFDTLSPRTLLDKLSSPQLNNCVTGCTQRVTVTGEIRLALVTNRVPQGPILSPVLFNMLINGLKARILRKFANNTKLGGAIDSCQGRSFAKSLHKSEMWTITNYVKFNKDKCRIPHLRQGALVVWTGE